MEEHTTTNNEGEMSKRDIAFQLVSCGQEMDTSRAYTWTEALELHDAYSRLAVSQTADPENWFAWYQIRKSKAADLSVPYTPPSEVTQLRFETAESVVQYVESLLSAMGYEFIRRENFESEALSSIPEMLRDASFMVCVLMMQYAWEQSISYVVTKGVMPAKPKFMIIPDPVFTPAKSKSTQKKRIDMDTMAQVEQTINSTVDTVMPRTRAQAHVTPPTEPAIAKKLQFSDEDSPQLKPGDMEDIPPMNPNLLTSMTEMLTLGKISVDEFLSVVAAMKEDATPRVGTATPATIPATPKTDVRAARYGQFTSGSREMTEENKELLSRDAPHMRFSQDRHVTTILQNVQLKTFDGSRGSSEEARQWISKFIHNANLSNWTEHQRLEVFSNQLAGPVSYWYKQLSRDVKSSWKLTLSAFIARFCTDHVPARLRYYKLTQKSDESTVHYLYRLNHAAQAAGLDYHNNSTHLLEHLQQFFDSANDRCVPLPLKIRQYESVEELEEVLVQYEASQFRSGRKAGAPGAANRVDPKQATAHVMDSRRSGDEHSHASIFTMQQQRNHSDRPQLRCEECGRRNHERKDCFRLMVCESCGRTGHPKKFCRELLDKVADAQRRFQSGEMSAEEFAKVLNP